MDAFASAASFVASNVNGEASGVGGVVVMIFTIVLIKSLGSSSSRTKLGWVYRALI